MTNLHEYETGDQGAGLQQVYAFLGQDIARHNPQEWPEELRLVARAGNLRSDAERDEYAAGLERKISRLNPLIRKSGLGWRDKTKLVEILRGLTQAQYIRGGEPFEVSSQDTDSAILTTIMQAFDKRLVVPGGIVMKSSLWPLRASAAYRPAVTSGIYGVTVISSIDRVGERVAASFK